MQTNLKKGFTLIELLVVVAIIGLLASIVIASLNSARQKGRDARRVSDLRQFQTAMEMFNDANSQYPTALSTASIGAYLASVPVDPVNSSPLIYKYAGLGGTSCTSYHLGATLEVVGSQSLSSAVHAGAGTACAGTSQSPTGSAADFVGTGYKDCVSTVGSPNQCYDLKVQ